MPPTVFQVLFQTGVLTPDGRAPTRHIAGMDHSPGGPQDQVRPQAGPTPVGEEETDHLLGAPRKGASDRGTGDSGTRRYYDNL